jgi:hypothetical protein
VALAAVTLSLAPCNLGTGGELTNKQIGLQIAQSIKDGQIVDLTTKAPTRKISTEKDDAACELEQKGFDIKYQEEIGRCMDKLETLEQELAQVYALIFVPRTCSSALRSIQTLTPRLRTTLWTY